MLTEYSYSKQPCSKYELLFVFRTKLAFFGIAVNLIVGLFVFLVLRYNGVNSV